MILYAGSQISARKLESFDSKVRQDSAIKTPEELITQNLAYGLEATLLAEKLDNNTKLVYERLLGVKIPSSRISIARVRARGGQPSEECNRWANYATQYLGYILAVVSNYRNPDPVCTVTIEGFQCTQEQVNRWRYENPVPESALLQIASYAAAMVEMTGRYVACLDELPREFPD